MFTVVNLDSAKYNYSQQCSAEKTLKLSTYRTDCTEDASRCKRIICRLYSD